MLIFSVDVFAVPANSTPRTYTQSDGSTITVIQHGDEYFHYYADGDDKLLILGDDKDFHYVKLYGHKAAFAALNYSMYLTFCRLAKTSDDIL